MKKLVSFFLFFTIITCLLNTSGCSVKKSFTPFPTTDQKLLGPQKPIKKWTFAWETDKSDSNPEFDQSVTPLGLSKDPCLDSSGNVYFSDFQAWLKISGNLYSLSQNGKLLWKRPKILTANLEGLENGVLNQDSGNVSCFNQKNILVRSYKIFNSFLSENKMLYGFRSYKNWFISIKNLFSHIWFLWFYGIGHVYNFEMVSFDFHGKLRWVYKIPLVDISTRRFTHYFSDSQGNVYFVFDQAKEDDATFNNRVPVYEMYSLTSTGKLRWKKEYPTKHFAGEDYGKKFNLLSNKLVVGNSFLVSEIKIPPYGNAEYYLQCLSTDGNLLWETKMMEDCELKVPCTMLDEKTFLVPIQDTKLDRTFLQAIASENGKVLWEKEIDSKNSTSPVVDAEGNIYIGAGGTEQKPRTIYSYTRSGSLRWSMVQTNPSQLFGTSLVLGPNRTLYYGLQGMNLLYCIGEK
jgi:outer membrane protein assembly factor BamB